MRNRKLTILHILGDYKFYIDVANVFKEFDLYENIYLYKSRSTKTEEYKKFKNKTNNVVLTIKNQDIINLIRSKDIDIIYLHGLDISNWPLVSSIPREKIIIWWSWGYDLYQKYGFISPFINIDSYRPLTKKLFVKRKSSELRNIIRYIKSLYYISYRRKALNNINYVQTVLDEEFNILKANPLLSHVERFFAPSVKVPTNFTIKKNSGFILIGNSANPTINHIDVLESLCRININNKRIIIPISYGDAAYKTFLKTQIQNHSYSFKIIFLEDFLPIKEYDNIFNNVSHAIFGVIRQKAIGNIRLCLTHGVKVFLYKNSIPYIDFKKHGYIIYSIEDDLTLEALNSPLSEHDAVYNFNLWAKYNRENQIRAIEVANSLCKKISDSHK